MSASKERRFNSYHFGEGRTGIGQAVEFDCPLDVSPETVRDFLRDNIRSIHVPTTGQVNMPHGGYGQYTRYDIKQHKYAGGGPGDCGGWAYIEVLEIKNPPDGRWSVIINECSSGRGGVFTEWETVKDAIRAYKKFWGHGIHKTAEEFPKLSGFRRRVVCGALTPWFYAIGEELLIGDYAFPDGLQDDPVYRFGRKFVVSGYDGVLRVKTCMGTRFVHRLRPDGWGKECEEHFRLVYWEDGSVWDESNSRDKPPRPLEEGELWITEALAQFQELLAGERTGFSINLTDGSRFVGQFKPANPKARSAEGDYLAVVKFRGKDKPREGQVSGFKPTTEAPDVVTFLAQNFARQGADVEYIEIKECKTKTGGKKWCGVFFRPKN